MNLYYKKVHTNNMVDVIKEKSEKLLQAEISLNNANGKDVAKKLDDFFKVQNREIIAAKMQKGIIAQKK